MNDHVPAERRRVQRVRLLQPIRGMIGAQLVFLLDVSLRGLRVAHQDPIGAAGSSCSVRAEWQGRRIDLECSITRSQVHRRGDSQFAKTLYHSGLTIVSSRGSSAEVLRELIHEHIERALDEQKANARGIPAVAPQSHHPARPTVFVRHELIVGRWVQTMTSDAAQPLNGFTLPSEHTMQDVQMLRAAWERGSRSEREVIRRMAELAVSADGVPVRRFVP